MNLDIRLEILLPQYASFHDMDNIQDALETLIPVSLWQGIESITRHLNDPVPDPTVDCVQTVEKGTHRIDAKSVIISNDRALTTRLD